MLHKTREDPVVTAAAETMTPAERRTQIGVVGGGAGGLGLVARLSKTFGRKHFDSILVDRNQAHIPEAAPA